MIAAYNPQIFDNLVDLHLRNKQSAYEKSNESYESQVNRQRETLRQLGLVICRHNMQSIAGVALLHRHFHLEGQERLVEERNPRLSVMKPYTPTNEREVCSYMWKFQDGAWYPLEFVRVQGDADTTVLMAERISMQTAFLQEFGETLVRLDAQDFFGLRILHRTHLQPRNDELILEQTDSLQRVITLKPIEQSYSGPKLETNWSFRSIGQAGVAIDVAIDCDHICDGHTG